MAEPKKTARKLGEEEIPPPQALEVGVDEPGMALPRPEPLVAPTLESTRPAQAPPPAAAPAPPAPTGPVKAAYRVWPYGTLQLNGKTYQPGETVSLREDEASKIPCLVKVDG